MYRSIKTKILLILLASTLLIVFTTAGFMYYAQRNRLTDMVQANAQEVTRVHGSTLGQLLENTVQLLMFTSEEYKVSERNSAEIIELLNNVDRLNPDAYINVIFIDPEGRVLDKQGRETDASDRDYFAELKVTKDNYIITEPIMGRLSNTSLFIIGVPMIEKGEFLGSVAAAISLERLYDEVKDYKTALSRLTMIVDSSGMILAHPDTLCCGDMTLDELLEADTSASFGSYLKGNASGQIRYMSRASGNHEVLNYTLIPGTDGWYLVTVTSLESIYQSIRPAVLQNAMYSIIFLLILMAVMSWLINSILKPLEKMNEAVDRSLKNNFEPIELDMGNYEMNHIINVYNDIALEYRTYTGHLEDLVTSRTQELNMLNDQLSRKNMELENTNQGLYSLATIDYLTGMYNRLELFRQLDILHRQIIKGKLDRCCILFADLDHFKYYNDTFGHAIGDRLLKHMSELINRHIKSRDFSARYGGDEFVIVLPTLTVEEGNHIGKRLIETVIDCDIEGLLTKWTGKKVVLDEGKRLSVSIGVALMDKDNLLTVDELIQKADEAMYENKYGKGKE